MNTLYLLIALVFFQVGCAHPPQATTSLISTETGEKSEQSTTRIWMPGKPPPATFTTDYDPNKHDVVFVVRSGHKVAVTVEFHGGVAANLHMRGAWNNDDLPVSGYSWYNGFGPGPTVATWTNATGQDRVVYLVGGHKIVAGHDPKAGDEPWLSSACRVTQRNDHSDGRATLTAQWEDGVDDNFTDIVARVVIGP